MIPDMSWDPSLVNDQQYLDYPQVYQYLERLVQSDLPDYIFPEKIDTRIRLFPILEPYFCQKIYNGEMMLTEIEKQSFCCDSDCLCNSLKNRFASFC